MNPFVITGPVDIGDLIDREDELEQMLGLARGGHAMRLSAPRRFGKTSLLARLGDRARSEGMPCVYVDCFGVLSLGELAARVEQAYDRDLRGRFGKAYAGLRREWKRKLRVGPRSLGMELESMPQEDASRLLQELLDLPLELHGAHEVTTLVLFDEFQDVLSAGDAADGLLRSRIQHHREAASYVFAGSHPGLMSAMFEDRERPLYGQARAIELSPLPDGATATFIDTRFTNTDRGLGRVLDDLLDLAQGHPQRTMLLAHHLWENTGKGTDAGAEEWSSAVQGAFAELQETFERSWTSFGVNERRVLTAVAWTGPWGHGTSLYEQGTLDRFRLKKSTARTVSQDLLRQGQLAREDAGRFRHVDPLFEAWIASERRQRW